MRPPGKGWELYAILFHSSRLQFLHKLPAVWIAILLPLLHFPSADVQGDAGKEEEEGGRIAGEDRGIIVNS